MESTFKPYEGDEPYIFVSYGRKDRDRVFSLLDALHDKGYRIWRDEGGIPWGVRWMQTIEDHITRAAVCLVFWSEASAASQHCEAETTEMVSEQKPIVTVFLDDTPVTSGLRMYLRRFQTVELADFGSDADFIERLEQERVFAPCKAEPEWNKIGEIQWKLDTHGVLTIAMNEDWILIGSIPSYQIDLIHDRSTAPWMPYREQIRSVVIRDDIYAIGDCAFFGCESLTSVTIGKSVTVIGDGAFMDCRGLTSVTVPDSVTTIGDGAFRYCKGLTSVTIPNGVTTIGEEAFWGCTGLTSITFPGSVTSIGDWAFADCVSLMSVTIPNSVTTIGDHAFFGCEGLTNVTIPDSVTVIGDRTFQDCASLMSVIISNGVTTIGDFAFYGCAGLTDVTIPDSVTVIGDGAFRDSEGLTKVEIPADAEVGEGAFDDHVQIIRRALRGE